ncbi:MAG: nucleotide exchange factor GrpE [Candidatus Thermoplasmatota archaeon]|nr:nucleotide exchange factor GrpE [Candidatus Thermoplasmatota archaeon]
MEEDTQKGEYLDRLLRLQAEYDNYRKSVEKRFDEERKLANERLVLKLLNVVDDFERMMKNIEDDKVKEGIEMIYKNMMKALESEGLEQIECVGKPFNPLEQEAIEVLYDGCGDETHDTVIEELRAGYKMNGKVIRAALVKVKGGKK